MRQRTCQLARQLRQRRRTCPEPQSAEPAPQLQWPWHRQQRLELCAPEPPLAPPLPAGPTLTCHQHNKTNSLQAFQPTVGQALLGVPKCVQPCNNIGYSTATKSAHQRAFDRSKRSTYRYRQVYSIDKQVIACIRPCPDKHQTQSFEEIGPPTVYTPLRNAELIMAVACCAAEQQHVGMIAHFVRCLGGLLLQGCCQSTRLCSLLHYTSLLTNIQTASWRYANNTRRLVDMLTWFDMLPPPHVGTQALNSKQGLQGSIQSTGRAL